MEKYVLSIYWQVDVRTKLIPRDTVINDSTPYGTLTSVKSPICDYTEDYTTMLCLELNEATTQKFIRQINEQTPLDIIKLYKIKIFFGVLGFATMELYATFDLASYPDLATTWVTIQDDNHKVVLERSLGNIYDQFRKQIYYRQSRFLFRHPQETHRAYDQARHSFEK